MKLKTIRIEKFRAIKSSVISVDGRLALVGQNSSGKSSVLRALNAFFNFEDEKKAFEEGRHAFLKTGTSEIELEFSDTPPECNLQRVRRGSNLVRLRLKYRKSSVWEIYANGRWNAIPPSFHEELNKFIRYIYVPVKRDHEVSGWGTSGLLRQAVEAWIKNQIKKRDGISPKVAALSGMIRKNAFDGLSKHLRKITPLGGGFTFALDYANSPDYGLLLRDLVLRVSEGATTVDLEDCGSGTQSMTALALYSYLAELESTTYILGIEEPEQNLHPQAQRELLSKLQTLPLQIIFTTHSTVIIDELQHEEVVLCRRSSSSSRGFEITTTQLSSDFWSKCKIDKERYYRFHHQRNSDFFFSRFVILTESSVDAEILRDLLTKANTDPNEYGVSIIDLGGVKSLPYAYHLMKALNFDFATVVDKDYFLPYSNDKLDVSRDARGFPRYRKEFKTGTLLETIIPSAAEREKLLSLLHINHSRAMDLLEKENFFCFKWSIEVDLVNSTIARNLIFRQLGITQQNQTPKFILEERNNVLKKLETLLPVLSNLEVSNLPNSYKRLRKSLPGLIKKRI